MMNCQWNPDGPPWKCQQCGYTYPRPTAAPPRRNCPKAPSRGLGDTIAKMTKAVGIKPCGGCKKRQRKLNQWWPYRSTVVPPGPDAGEQEQADAAAQ